MGRGISPLQVSLMPPKLGPKPCRRLPCHGGVKFGQTISWAGANTANTHQCARSCIGGSSDGTRKGQVRTPPRETEASMACRGKTVLVLTAERDGRAVLQAEYLRAPRAQTGKAPASWHGRVKSNPWMLLPPPRAVAIATGTDNPSVTHGWHLLLRRGSA